jgi:nudix-type nucleoside diphosphatase (YffH/AdpP family)
MYEITATRIAHEGWAKLMVASIRTPDGKLITREIEHHGTAVCVLPYNAKRKTAILIRQFRAPPLLAAGLQETLEAVAGILDESDPRDAARRETREETGVTLLSLQPLFETWTMPGISTERMQFYLGTYDEPPHDVPHGVASEAEITHPVEIPLKDLAALADAGALTDMKTLLVLQTLRLREPDLFE